MYQRTIYLQVIIDGSVSGLKMEAVHEMKRFLIILLGFTFGCEESDITPPRAVPVDLEVFPFKVISLNLRYENLEDQDYKAWAARVIDIVRFVQRERPSIFATQEGLYGPIADLRASLSDYGFIGLGRSDGKKSGEFAGIFYRQNRFDATESGTFWLSGTPELAGSMTWGNKIPRIATYVRLTERWSKISFWVVNLHLDHRSQVSREKGLELVIDRIQSLNIADEPVVLLGDFNAVGSNPALRKLSGAFIDTFQNAGNRGTAHFWRAGSHRSWRLDRIYISKGFEVLGAGIFEAKDPPLSDHFPVWTELTFD